MKKVKNRKLMLSTHMAIYLALNVQVRHDGRDKLLTIPLLPLTGWVWWVWQARLVVSQLTRELTAIVTTLTDLAVEVYESTVFAATICGIGFKSTMYGLGMRV